jgi:hypothetical protein
VPHQATFARVDDAVEPFVVGVDHAQLAASFARFAGAAGFDLAGLRTSLARLAPGLTGRCGQEVSYAGA